MLSHMDKEIIIIYLRLRISQLSNEKKSHLWSICVLNGQHSFRLIKSNTFLHRLAINICKHLHQLHVIHHKSYSNKVFTRSIKSVHILVQKHFKNYNYLNLDSKFSLNYHQVYSLTIYLLTFLHLEPHN